VVVEMTEESGYVGRSVYRLNLWNLDFNLEV
jgi:hypothetical protein